MMVTGNSAPLRTTKSRIEGNEMLGSYCDLHSQGGILNPHGKVGDTPKSSGAVLISSPNFRRLSKALQASEVVTWLQLGDSCGLGSAHVN